MTKKKKKSEEEDDDNKVKGQEQLPPPHVHSHSEDWDDDHDDHDDDKKHKHHGDKHLDHEVTHAIYDQLAMTRKTLDELLDEAKEAKVRKQLDQLPINVSDLMRGFQGAVSRANRAVEAGEDGGEDIERMVIKNLEISLDAPLINEAHAEDPMIMLPNENSSNHDQAKVSLKFSVVNVPKSQRQ